ncbi:class I SAM-dependent RNA methyltransferase [Rhizomicrobium palustre]|nr:hypothetical protein [Rhizomicrobium palustre]
MLCRHFGACGGCQYQDLPDDAYRALKQELVLAALKLEGVAAELRDVVEVPPATRRRAALKVKLKDGVVEIGFHAAKTHDIVDMAECQVMTPALLKLLPGLRRMFKEVLAPRGDADMRLTETDAGVDLALRWNKKLDEATRTALAIWADKLGLVRVSVGGQVLTSFAEAKVRLGKASVPLPPEAFLQPSREGEAILQGFVREALSGAKKIADLFSGCGTFSFVLAEKARVHAVELEAPMLEALAAGVKSASGLKPITTEKRNLFKRPLTRFELNLYDGLCLDPPRAGALEQAKEIAASKLPRIAYVSCDATTFARDAKVLIDGGYKLGPVLPVDQFLWSSHIELAAQFTR